MKTYTGIGSRETPDSILELMEFMASVLAAHGWTLRSGHAQGADQAFERGAIKAEGLREIYLPWPGFNNAPRSPEYHPYQSVEAWKLAEQFHPAWDRCSSSAQQLHARNTHQILGPDTGTPSDIVICWTKNGWRKGGTGQALRLAEAYEIPIFDLAISTPEEISYYLNTHFPS